VLTVAATLTLTPLLGIVGLCLGLLAGRLPQTLAYPRLVASCLGQRRTLGIGTVARRLLVMAALFSGAGWLGQRVSADDWLTWAAGAALSAAATLVLALLLGLSASGRRRVLERYRSMGGAFRGR
jgi:hypothetical protein